MNPEPAMMARLPLRSGPRTLAALALAPWRAFRREPAAPLSALMIAVLGLLALPPVLALLESSFSTVEPDGSLGAFTLANYGRLLADPRLVSSTLNSLGFAVLTTLLSLLCGGGLAWIVERTNAPWRELAHLTTFVSLAMPGVLAILAWLFLLGRVGPLNEFARFIGGGKDNLFNVYSMSGMVVIDTFSWLPFVFLLFSAAFRVASADFEDAARMSGASLLATLRRVSLPLARPAMLATALFVFIRTLQEFDVPLLVGGPAGINLLTTEIYRSINQVPSDFAHASAFSVALTATTAILMYFYGRMARHANKYATVTGKSFRPRTVDLGRWRWWAGALILLQFLVVVGLPLFALGWVSLMPYVQAIGMSGLPLATFANYAEILQDERYLRLGLNTLLMAGLAATGAMLLMGIAGWLVARRKPGGAVLNQLATLPLLIPGIVLGVSVMQIALRSPVPIYGTYWIIVLAYLVMLHALRDALHFLGRAADPSRARGGRQCGGSRRAHRLAPDRGAAASAGARLGLASHLSQCQPRVVDRGRPRRAEDADHVGRHLRNREIRPIHRARGARPHLDLRDDRLRDRFLRPHAASIRQHLRRVMRGDPREKSKDE